MCLCEGKGNIAIEYKGVIQWHKCPDSHCQFDKQKAEKKWQQFKLEMREWEERAERDHAAG